MFSTSPWQLVYHLCGLTVLGSTPQQPLGAVPAPVRAALLHSALQLDSSVLEAEFVRTPLLFGAGEHVGVRAWRFTGARPGTLRDRQRRASTRTYASLDDFIRAHDLTRPTSGSDEHFAERIFLEEAFVPAFGLHGLSLLTPQERFTDSLGKARRIDFALHGDVKYAIEIEGAAYHARDRVTPEVFEDEKSRQRDLGAHGYRYVPFTVNDIRSGRAEAVLNELAMMDATLGRVWRAHDQGLSEGPSDAKITSLLEGVPQAFARTQTALLALLAETTDRGDAELHVVDAQAASPVIGLALLDLVACAERIFALYGQQVRLPRIHLTVHRPADEALYRSVLEAFLGESLQPNAATPDAWSTPFNVTFSNDPLDVDAADVVLAPKPFPSRRPVLLPHDLDARSHALLAQVGRTPPLQAQPVSPQRDVLDFFARRFFGVPELKPEQFKLVARALRQTSGLGLLPTGFGKSLVFQLFALLIPRTSLVISPLKALIRDQIHGLHRQGLVCAESISSTDSKAAKEAKLDGFRTHAYRLLYVAPERLQIKGFYEELRASMSNTPVGALVVDEAHCVSEWGHDFRPAYLQIGRLRTLLREASGRDVPIIALTATASAPVRADVLRVLGLDEGDVEQLASSDRPTISLSVHALNDSPYRSKADLLAHVVHDVVPKALRMKYEDIVPLRASERYEHAGVVFAVYANPHGKSSVFEGVHAIAKSVRERLLHDPAMVNVHASSSPSYCPECNSTMFVSASPKEIRAAGHAFKYGSRCLECDSVFQRAVYDDEWEEKVLATQDDFGDSRFPLLVATKGYGMGIDKRNIRFIVHHALSSGLEGYYQEAGRAGRDGAHAHAALIYAPPTESCWSQHLSKDGRPPCVTDERNFKFHKCPFGLESLCDYGRQARFVQESYPGVEHAVEQVEKTLERVVSGQAIETDDDEDLKHTQLSLYRLQQLGVLRGYALQYTSLRRVRFHIDLNPAWTVDSVRTELEDLLRQSGTPDPAKVMAPVLPRVSADGKERRRVNAASAGENKLDVLRKALTVLLDEVYRTVPRMRYQMLRNELAYARSRRDGVCRRVVIRGIFDTIDHIDQNTYNCGFCDVCVPDLQFKQTSATVPTRDVHIEQVARELHQVIETFDPASLRKVAELAVEHGATIGILARATHILERDGTNLSALYLAGDLSAHRPGQQEAALDYLRFGFEESARRGTDRDAVSLFYERARDVNPDHAFSWIVTSGSPFDTGRADDLKYLEGEATRTFGESSTSSRALRARRSTLQLGELRTALQRDVLMPLADLNAALQEITA
ncbi:DEAD/DEAH box helicase [Deinococcus yavapaiensis]|uniref:DNA 3'-5' helicase n=1 Tax=Deinococcus yavapaiensis KR-236 TaxID=694435 RepID=A0A318S6L5_9DEIO|nr:DEAD/DEAH box helicase [Deinococcus yavapaiensis]PYE53289.1 ATP-dependent DNA helicase RecQ [Deinococcus yavapaiensis KR-236]